MKTLELAAAFASGACFANRWIKSAIVLLIIHGLFDYLDGGLQQQMRSAVYTGPSLRHTGVDKLSDVLLFAGLAVGELVPWWLAVAASYYNHNSQCPGLLGEKFGRLKRADCLFDRSDRVLLLLILSGFSRFTAALFVVLGMNTVVIAQRLGTIILYRSKPHEPTPKA